MLSPTVIEHTVRVLAAPIGPHQPDGSGLPGARAINTIIEWTMYGALVACVLALIAAGGMVAIGNTSARPHVAERGKVTLLWSLAGAVIVGVAIPLVNRAFGLA
ncbi:MAG: DUF6112 family protein [Pseudonocardiaceae bacterium]